MKTYTTPVLTDLITTDDDNNCEIVFAIPAIAAAIPAIAAVASAVTAVAGAVASAKGKNSYMEINNISSLDKVD